MKCKNCGAHILGSAKVCEYCDTPVTALTETASVPMAARQPEEPPPQGKGRRLWGIALIGVIIIALAAYAGIDQGELDAEQLQIMAVGFFLAAVGFLARKPPKQKPKRRRRWSLIITGLALIAVVCNIENGGGGFSGEQYVAIGVGAVLALIGIWGRAED